jgi:hypothetical protein
MPPFRLDFRSFCSWLLEGLAGGATLVASATGVASAGGLGLLRPVPPSRHGSCHLLSQRESPLAIPHMRCNLLMTKPFVLALPAGMACALSESGDWTESREAADAVIEAPCDTSRRVSR